ncbi:MAG: hypothetical protein PUP91_09595 [Rhizonema sp. PD37]|nr:hypothetical protein [Rhizonema sp. PD37]
MGEREGGKQSKEQVSRLTTLWVDGGNDCEPQIVVGDGHLSLPKRRRFCDQSKAKVLSCSKNVGWWSALMGKLMGCWRLLRDYELLPETSEIFIYLAMIRIMVRLLA